MAEEGPTSLTGSLRLLVERLKRARDAQLNADIRAGIDYAIVEIGITLGNRPAPTVAPSVMDEVIAAVAAFYGVKSSIVVNPGSKRSVKHHRWVAWALLRWHCGLSFPQIGRRFGADHTTVMTAVVRVAEMPELAEHVERLATSLGLLT